MNLFEKYNYDIQKKLDNFEKYVNGTKLARFIARYELFKKVMNVSGSIVECGVHYGGGLFAWAKLSNALEPYNYKRKIIGFDTFEGFTGISKKDINKKSNAEIKEGGYNVDQLLYEELNHIIDDFETNKFVRFGRKINLIKGNAIHTIPDYLDQNPHTLVSLLFLDFDIYEPTKIALDKFLPRMPKGAIIAFDEVNNAEWPGETLALLETYNMNKYKLEHLDIYSPLSFVTL